MRLLLPGTLGRTLVLDTLWFVIGLSPFAIATRLRYDHLPAGWSYVILVTLLWVFVLDRSRSRYRRSTCIHVRVGSERVECELGSGRMLSIPQTAVRGVVRGLGWRSQQLSVVGSEPNLLVLQAPEGEVEALLSWLRTKGISPRYSFRTLLGNSFFYITTGVVAYCYACHPVSPRLYLCASLAAFAGILCVMRVPLWRSWGGLVVLAVGVASLLIQLYTLLP